MIYLVVKKVEYRIEIEFRIELEFPKNHSDLILFMNTCYTFASMPYETSY